MNLNFDFSLKKKNKRKLGSFFSNQLLYLYAQGLLDSERAKCLDDNLTNDDKTQKEYIKLTNGLQYLDKLSETLVGDEIIFQIENRSSQLAKFLDVIKFQRWPVTLKWGLEASVITVSLVVFLNLIPWSKIVFFVSSDPSNELIIAEVDKRKKEESEVPANSDQKPEFADEGSVKVADKEIKKSDLKSANSSTELLPSKNSDKSKKIETVDMKAAQNDKKVSQTNLVTDIVPIGAKNQNPTQADLNNKADVKNSSLKSQGYLYRGQISVTNVEMISPKIKDKVNEMGGRKAGEVEIGWKKTNQTYYYHFTIPEAKIKDLQDFISIYSDAKLVKEPHPRVMPEGIVRIIFTVEEKSK